MMPPSKHDREVAEWEPTRRLEYERTRLRVLVAARIDNLLSGLNLKQADLAKRIGKSSAWVSKLLSGNQNLTLDTLAEIGWALGVRWDIQPYPAIRDNTPASGDEPLPDWVYRQSKIVVRQMAASGYSVIPTDPLSDINALANVPVQGSSGYQSLFIQQGPPKESPHLLSSLRFTAGAWHTHRSSCVTVWSNVDLSGEVHESGGFVSNEPGVDASARSQVRAGSSNIEVSN
jgi:transcriptional regulator with XRE-family HTH domain